LPTELNTPLSCTRAVLCLTVIYTLPTTGSIRAALILRTGAGGAPLSTRIRIVLTTDTQAVAFTAPRIGRALILTIHDTLSLSLTAGPRGAEDRSAPLSAGIRIIVSTTLHADLSTATAARLAEILTGLLLRDTLAVVTALIRTTVVHRPPL